MILIIRINMKVSFDFDGTLSRKEVQIKKFLYLYTN